MSGAVDKLVDVFSSLGASPEPELSYGVVSALEPLAVRREGSGGVEITENFLVLSPICREYSIPYAIHSHKVPEGGRRRPGFIRTIHPRGRPTRKGSIPTLFRSM